MKLMPTALFCLFFLAGCASPPKVAFPTGETTRIPVNQIQQETAQH